MIQQEKNKKVLCLFCVLFSVSLALPIAASAAEFNLTSQTQEIRIGDKFEVGFFVNTENEDINAIEGKIAFPANILELKEIKDGNSIINFWIERPSVETLNNANISADKHEGIGGDSCLYSCKFVSFSGITPGGFKSENGFVFSLVFEPKEKNKGRIEFSGIRALKNDGLGSPVDVFAQPLEFEIAEAGLAPEESVEIKARDYEPPESFAPEIARDETLFNGKWFVVFAAQDKSSGIDHYEILEYRRQDLGFREFMFRFFPKFYIPYSKFWFPHAESPRVLRDQELRSFVFVKAVDKAGNERIETISPRNPLKWYENYLIYVIIIVIIFIGCILWKIFNKSKIKYQKLK